MGPQEAVQAADRERNGSAELRASMSRRTWRASAHYAVRLADLKANDAVVDGGGEELGNLLDNVAVLRRVEPPEMRNGTEYV
jgi:hypothetical protein